MGEHVWRVPPLPVPPAAGGDAYPSVSLFAERAAAVVPGFAVTPDNQQRVAEICRRLDGLPLAIELAAAQLRTMSVDRLADRLRDRMRVLAAGPAVHAHQRTLEATFDWSFDLCSPAEQELWRKLSVFVGGFDLAAAGQVCGEPVLEAVCGLVDKSVLVREEGAGRPRYRLLETVRQHGLSRLGADELAALRCRHLDWYRSLAKRYDAAWFGPDQAEWAATLRADRGNIQAALNHSLTPDGRRDGGCALDIVADLEAHWLGGGSMPREGRYWLARVLAAEPAVGVARVRALAVQAHVLIAAGEFAASGVAGRESLELARQLDEPALAVRAAGCVGMGALMAGADPGPARALLEDALVELDSLPVEMPVTTVLAKMSLAMALTRQRQYDRAAELCAEAAAFSDRHGERWMLGNAMMGSATVEVALGRPARADAYLRQALGIRAELGDFLGEAIAFDQLAVTAAELGEYRRCAALFGAARERWGTLGQDRVGSEQFRLRVDAAEASARAALGDGAFDAACRAGAAMTIDDAIGRAPHRAGRTPTVRVLGGATGLTPREREVAELIAQGLSNKQIAATLAVAIRTAESHVENILRKLQLGSRSQVAAWYTEHGRDG
jgi:non-specific serine/threonine protein kinase